MLWLPRYGPCMPLHYVDPRKKHSRFYQAQEKFFPFAPRTVLGAPFRPSHGPVVVPQDRGALSIDLWRDVHRSADDHGCKVGSKREHQITYFHDGPDPIVTASNYGGANTRSGTTTSRRILNANSATGDSGE